jgi:hypothetical protein
MASKWLCKVLGQQVGPVSFREMAEMVRSGTLKEDDPVRREGASQWTRAGEVIGLFRAAAKEPAQARPESKAEPKPVQASGKTKQAEPPSAKPRRIGRGRVLLASGLVLALLLLVVGVSTWRRTRTPTFPEPVAGRPRPVGGTDWESILGPSPKVPSIPGLEVGVPELVPGLEGMDICFGATLTADLRTIVFSGRADPKKRYDLYLATRDEVSRPFGEPELIKSCVSRGDEAYPTLSPDGLELLFRRFHALWHSTRQTTSSRFQKPVRWSAPELDPEVKHLDRPRLVDPLHLLFTAIDVPSGTRSLWMAERATTKTEFKAARELPGPTLAHAVFTERGLHAYLGTSRGLTVMVRQAATEQFGPRIPIADDKSGGPVESMIWIAPQEDVIFYMSSGPGKEHGSERQLYMLRFS